MGFVGFVFPWLHPQFIFPKIFRCTKMRQQHSVFLFLFILCVFKQPSKRDGDNRNRIDMVFKLMLIFGPVMEGRLFWYCNLITFARDKEINKTFCLMQKSLLPPTEILSLLCYSGLSTVPVQASRESVHQTYCHSSKVFGFLLHKI